ncbi:alpha/beta fold hydrolase [Flavobacterium chuncheonense]|uniref:Alpha/beta fold hydrolase n=1 Tax=Flavobacterium chuncheonense TaxID=2026653 RepID=A0ABW5YN22_9FLAO
MKKILLVALFFGLQVIVGQQPTEMKNILSTYHFKTHFVKINETETAYIKEGNGPQTLLFIHGLSSNIDAWYRNIDELKKHYTCIAIDLPGHGKSSKKTEAYTPTFYATFIHDFIKKMKLKNITLVGHSMGGQAAIKTTTLYPHQINALILVAPAGIETFTEKEANLLKQFVTTQNVQITTDAQIEKNYQLNFHQFPTEAQSMITDRINIKKASDFTDYCYAIEKSVEGMLIDPTFDDLEKITQKTLILFGKNDNLIPNNFLHPKLTVTEIGTLANEKIKQSTLHFVAESGHFLQFEKPDEVNLLILNWLSKNNNEDQTEKVYRNK